MTSPAESSVISSGPADAVEAGAAAAPRLPGTFDEKQHHAQTASRITYVLLAVLGTSVLAQYGGVMAAHFSGFPELAEALEGIFKVWLPVLSGLLGSALAFYFTQRRS